MNLEEELRAVLSQEADMRTTPAPDIERIVVGGESRRRRRNTTRIGLAAATALLVGGIYGAAQLSDDESPDVGIMNQPSEQAGAGSPPNWPDDGPPPEAGTYRTFVGVAETGAIIEADFTIDGEGWAGSNYPVAFTPRGFAGFGVYKPDGVAGGCQMEDGLQVAATEPQELVQQLVRLPRSEVVQQPAPTEAFGSTATHLQLRIDAACGGGAAYLVADALTGGRGISYFDESSQGDGRMVIVDFWVVEVDGTPMVVDKFHLETAPDELVAQATRAVESITFVADE